MNSFVAAGKNTSCAMGEHLLIAFFGPGIASSVLYTCNLHKNLSHGHYYPYFIDDEAGLREVSDLFKVT